MGNKKPSCYRAYHGKFPVKNYRLAEARVSKGLNIEQIAFMLGIPPITYESYETLRADPSEELKAKISEILGKETVCLFPPHFQDYVDEKRKERTMKRRGIKSEDVCDNLHRVNLKISNFGFRKKRENLSGLFEEAFFILDKREKLVVKMRYGFSDGKEHTLEETGEVVGFTGERTRQIEGGALAKLRKFIEQELDYSYFLFNQVALP